MRRFFVSVFLVIILVGQGRSIVSAALDESNIESRVNAVNTQVSSDFSDAQNFKCGGQMQFNDERALAYYSRRGPLTCNVKESCDEEIDADGKCIGYLCMGLNANGKLQGTRKWNCSSGTCEQIWPSTECSLNGWGYRIYECKEISNDVKCYTNRIGYNCIVEYDSSPVLTSEPMGFMETIARPADGMPVSRREEEHWSPVFGSNASTLSNSKVSLAPLDSSIAQLELDNAEVPTHPGVIHPFLAASIPFFNNPTISEALTKLMRPPHVNIILPRGGASLSHDGSELFEKLFTELEDSEEDSPMVQTLGNEPDALLLAAEYLRSIPLVEVKYEPITVRAPAISNTSLIQLIKEWETWLGVNRDALDSSVVTVVEENIETMYSYIALQESIHEYRIQFPKYLDALLGYVEDVNEFFREEWIDVNATRLEDWHNSFRSFLEDGGGIEILAKIQEIHALGAKFTHCMAQTCRLDAIPVDAGIKPVDLNGFFRAPYGIGSINLWETDSMNRQDLRMSAWPPFNLVNMPLPDLTFDFSNVYLERAVNVPVIKVEMHAIALMRPPSIYMEDLWLSDFGNQIEKLPRLRAPAFDLTFPSLDLPDPTDELFVIPEAPTARDRWNGILTDMKKRITNLVNVCDPFSTDTFLVRESTLRDPDYDPASVRAYAFIMGTGSDIFSSPPKWPSWPYNSLEDVSLMPPNLCPNCVGVRPHRVISQHMELEARWEHLQDKMFKAIDEWNAQVSYWSVISRDELTRISPMKH